MFNVNRETCIACMQCIKDCPAKVISLKEGKAEINNTGCIKCGHCIAICPTYSIATDDYDMNEVIPYNKDDFTIEPERLLNFIRFRRSIRRYKAKEVEKEKINMIIQAGRFTQTGRNLQDVYYTVITDKMLTLKELVLKSLKGKSDYILSNTPKENKNLRRYATLWDYMYSEFMKDPSKNDKLFYNAPSLIVITADNHLDGGLAASNMELMCNALGLGTFFCGFMTVACENNSEILDFLKLDDSSKIVACMVIGYPDVHYKRTTPRKKAEIRWI